MSTYNPDVWVRVRITTDSGKFDRILAGWYGGYAGSDNWKMNSGIVDIAEGDDCWIVTGFSGSVYICHKQTERFSNMTASVFETFNESLKAAGATIEVIPMSTEFASA